MFPGPMAFFCIQRLLQAVLFDSAGVKFDLDSGQLCIPPWNVATAANPGLNEEDCEEATAPESEVIQ